MRTLWRTLVVVSAGMVLLAGCMSTSVTRVGSETFAPLPETTPVLVFSSESEIGTSYITLGIVHSSAQGGAFQSPYTLADVMGALKLKALEVGANALIIDQTRTTGSVGTGLDVSARAVRIPDKLPQSR